MIDESFNPYASPEAENLVESVPQGDRLSLPGMRTTGVGLSMVYYGILLILFAVVVVIILNALFHANQQGAGANPDKSYLIVLMCCGLAVFLGELTRIAGIVLCVFVPSQSQAKIYILFSAVLHLLAAGLGWGTEYFSKIQVLFGGQAIERDPSIYPLITVISNLVGFVLFLVFLRKLAYFIVREDIARRVRNVFLCTGVLLVIVLGIFAGVFARAEVFFLLGFVLLIAGLVFVVMFLNLVNALRQALFGKKPPSAPQSFLLSRHER